MNFEEVEIKITLSGVWWRDPPRCEIYLDQMVIDRLYVSANRLNSEKRDILFKGNLTEGQHWLTVRFLNKKDDDDQFDENGVSTLLQHLHIENITINKINFDISKGSKCCKLKKDKVVRPYPSGLLTENCDWSLRFSVPTYVWLMENS